jgi:hypothetical protein
VLLALIAGAIFGIEGGLRVALAVRLFFGLTSGMLALVLYLLIGGLTSGLHRGLLAPNEGMRRSRRNAIVGGLPFAIPFGVLTAVLYGTQFGGAQFGAITGLHTMLPIWVLAGLWAGGRAYLRHLAVRALLWRTGRAPWEYVAFLDDATDHLILQRVGRGYQFVHALLLDHFANLNQASNTSPRASASAGVSGSRACDAEERQQSGGVAGVAAQRCGDVAVSVPLEDADGEVTC